MDFSELLITNEFVEFKNTKMIKNLVLARKPITSVLVKVISDTFQLELTISLKFVISCVRNKSSLNRLFSKGNYYTFKCHNLLLM